ncbi:hypothetical protein D9M68_925510 [compost metagenome]
MAYHLNHLLCAEPCFNTKVQRLGCGQGVNSHQIVGDQFHRDRAPKPTDVELDVGDRIEHRLAVLHQVRVTAQKQGSLA